MCVPVFKAWGRSPDEAHGHFDKENNQKINKVILFIGITRQQNHTIPVAQLQLQLETQSTYCSGTVDS